MFRVPAVCRDTGAFCLVDAPVGLGSPADHPELALYTTLVGQLVDSDASLWHQVVQMRVTTQWKKQDKGHE